MVKNQLTNDALRLLLELDGGDVIPPLVDVTDVVELPALVVKAVRDLVADDHPDAAKVQALREKFVVKWRL